MKKFRSIGFTLLTAIMTLCCFSSMAHSGGTDSYGGHVDKNTGIYHYHHGYPAHQHTGRVCPYDPDYFSNGLGTTVSDDGKDVSIRQKNEDNDDSYVNNGKTTLFSQMKIKNAALTEELERTKLYFEFFVLIAFMFILVLIIFNLRAAHKIRLMESRLLELEDENEGGHDEYLIG